MNNILSEMDLGHLAYWCWARSIYTGILKASHATANRTT